MVLATPGCGVSDAQADARAACKVYTPDAPQVTTDAGQMTGTETEQRGLQDAIRQARSASEHAAKAAASDPLYKPLATAYLELSDELTYFHSALNSYGWTTNDWTEAQRGDLRNHITAREAALSTIRSNCQVLVAK
jgi:hypothetical protein